jgi:hypothetical protein
MTIILHILLKDLRRHWREVGLFAAVTAGWAWQQAHPYQWGYFIQQKQALPILFFLLWFFITVRVVQGESLVGDREFWTTRPYRWWQLMAAKACFLVVCLNLPLIAMQIYLLNAAGLPLRAALIPGLIWLQLAFALLFTLSAAALAAVTESLVQWVLVVVGFALFGLLASWPPWDKLPVTLAGAEGTSTLLGFVIVGAALVFVLLWQYIRRRVWTARIVLAAAILAVPAIVALSCSPWMRSISYPLLSSTKEPPLHLAIAEKGERTYTRTNRRYEDPIISVPVSISSMAPDTMVVIEGNRFTLEGDNGWHWQSPWLRTDVILAGEESGASLKFEMPYALADQMRSKHAKVQAELALAVYRLSAPRRIDTSPERFEMADIASCRWGNPDLEFNKTYLVGIALGTGVNCFAPLRLPDLVIERVESADVTCPPEQGEPPLPAGHHAVDFVWDTDGGPADFDTNPVHRLAIAPVAWIPNIPTTKYPKGDRQVSVCRGTPITIRVGSFSSRMGIAIDLGDLGRESAVNQKESVDLE